METGTALSRAAVAVVAAGAHIINMSFGEPAAVPNQVGAPAASSRVANGAACWLGLRKCICGQLPASFPPLLPPTPQPGSHTTLQGRVIDVVSELVERHNVIYVASAGGAAAARARRRRPCSAPAAAPDSA
jgi:hypothetical protein